MARPPASPLHLPADVLEAGLDHIRQSPTDDGVVQLIVRRPAVGQREVLHTGELDLAVGLVGDNWRTRGNRFTSDGSADPDAQLTVMNYRCAALVAGSPDRVPLAGDQLYLDLDLRSARVPAGSRFAIGEMVIEITTKTHRGCDKFAARFGVAALQFVNLGAGRDLNLRGRNARVVAAGTIRRGDRIRRLPTNGLAAAELHTAAEPPSPVATSSGSAQ